jgi:hypothetical protein
MIHVRIHTQVIEDANNNTASSATILQLAGPPAIQSPAAWTVNASDTTGASVALQPPASLYCGLSPCTVTVLFNGTLYAPGASVKLPVATTPLLYTVTDSAGHSATSPTTVNVAGPPAIAAPAPLSVNAYMDPNATVVVQVCPANGNSARAGASDLIFTFSGPRALHQNALTLCGSLTTQPLKALHIIAHGSGCKPPSHH